VVLVLSNRIGKEQLRLVSECSCDEVLIAPMAADQLYDVIAIQLGLPRRGARRFDIALKIATDHGDQPVGGRVTNFSVDGARLLLDSEIAEGSMLRLEILPSGEPPMSIAARVVWAQKREGGCTLGAAFEEITPEQRQQLSRLTLWEILHDTERPRFVIKGDITEATRFDDLLPALVGQVDFDLGQVRYMNSLGVREWVELLQRAPIQGYEFHACSVAFVLQASLVRGVLGRGVVRSFFAPYACDGCGHTEERLLQAAAVLSEDQQPPSFACRGCGGHLVLDDIAERYLAFLRPMPED
jgi:hypothetical protein